jgi:hypothetical protein
VSGGSGHERIEDRFERRVRPAFGLVGKRRLAHEPEAEPPQAVPVLRLTRERLDLHLPFAHRLMVGDRLAAAVDAVPVGGMEGAPHPAPRSPVVPSAFSGQASQATASAR